MCLSSYYIKFIESFIYNKDFRNEVYLGKYKLYIYTEEFILSLKKYIDELENINLNKIERLHQLIIFMGCVNQNSENLINKKDLSLLHNLNSKLLHLSSHCFQYEDKSKFFVEQIIKRMDIDKYDFDDIYKYQKCKNDIINSFHYDFKILELFVIQKDDLFFEQISLFINDKYFWYSLNGLIIDMPFLLENEVFKLKIMHMFEMVDILKIDNEEIKRMNEILKKCIVLNKVKI